MSTHSINLKQFFIISTFLSVTALSLGGCAAPEPVVDPMPAPVAVMEPSHEEMKDQMVAEVIKDTSPAMRAQTLTELMTKRLSLNEGQAANIGKINLAYSRRFSVLMNSNNPDIKKKAEFQRLSAEKELKIKGVLNQSQIKAYNQNKAAYMDTYRIM